jgi:hypothetical protein
VSIGACCFILLHVFEVYQRKSSCTIVPGLVSYTGGSSFA